MQCSLQHAAVLAARTARSTATERPASLQWLLCRGGQGLVTQELELRAIRAGALSVQAFPHIPVTGYHLPDGQESSFESELRVLRNLQRVLPAQLHPVEGIHCQVITLKVGSGNSASTPTSEWTKRKDPLL